MKYLVIVAAALALAGCASHDKIDPHYRPPPPYVPLPVSSLDNGTDRPRDMAMATHLFHGKARA